MKKLMMVCIAGLLVFAFAGTVLAFDEEENDIRKRHEKWIRKVMLGLATEPIADGPIHAVPQPPGIKPIAPGPIFYEQGVSQRKTVEAQIQLKGNEKNYTFSPQMADQPKEAVPLQKKQ